MVAPTAFTFNEQAAQDNAFMHSTAAAGTAVPETSVADGSLLGAAPASGLEVSQRVLQEHRGMYEQLSQVSLPLDVHNQAQEHVQAAVAGEPATGCSKPGTGACTGSCHR